MGRMVRNLWLMVLAGVLFAILFFVSLTFSDLPSTNELENPTFEYATKIYTSDRKELGRYFKKNRDWVYPEDLNPHLINALVATEDERFYKHSGIDYKGTMRAVVYGGNKGGASTITQQLAKLLFHKRERKFAQRVLQKFKEWIIAIRIEKRYTKDEIISMYLNKFDFIYDSNGIAAAAKTYFGKDQKRLNIEEASVLIGMLKNPWIYNPKKFPTRAKLRRDVVMKQMLRNDFIDETKYKTLLAKPLDMSRFRRQEDSEGLAPYFRSELTKWLRKILAQEEYKKPDGSSYDLYRDGLKIYTTIDSKIQTHAEAAVQTNMKKVQKRYFQVWKNKDPWTYRADKDQKKIRNRGLNELIKQTEQYQTIKDRYMSEVFNKVKIDFPDAQLRDVDVLRMFKQSRDKAYFDRLYESKLARRDQIASYKAIRASKHWKTIQSRWKTMEKAVRVAFNKKRKMKVYDYQTGNYKQVTMTPIDSIKFHRKHMQSGMLAIEPSTGYVRAWVGGVNHRVFQYDHVNSRRQVGSTFKPFIYSTAIFMNGMSPCWEVEDVQYTIPARDANFNLLKKWQPANANNKFSGEALTLYEGLRKSKNSVSVYLMKELGNTEPVRNVADKMGIPKDRIPAQPSICLGTPELSLFDMTSAYSTFANKGIHNEPIFVTRIENKDGQLIYSSVPEQSRALPENYNYVMVDMLRHAAKIIDPKIHVDVGGKTGTTNDYVDGWFMGITPNLVVGTWVGGEDNWIRFLRIEDGQGGKMARPAFVDLMQRIESDKTMRFDTSARFVQPENFDIAIDCEVYSAKRRAIETDDDDIDEDLFDDIEQ